MNKNVKYVLFDLDGTLTDSGIGITKAVAYALKKFNIEIDDLRELFKFIGPPLEKSFAEYFNLSEKDTNLAMEYFHEYYDETGIYENFPYDGITDVLAKLRNDGIKLVIATSKPTVMADIVLKHFDLEKYFDFIATASMDRTRRSKEEVLKYAIDNLGIIDMSTAIMVGDTRFDVEGAHSFGMKCIAVSYGYGTIEELKAAGADFIAALPEDILDIYHRVYE